MSIDPDMVVAALADIRRRIAAAGGGDEVRIVAVTKGHGPDAIRAAAAAGCTMIGESYAQELIAKRDECEGVAVQFVGRLQTNKVRQLAGLVDVYGSVDRPRLADEIARRAPGATVLIQVDSTGIAAEGGKGGWPLGDVDELVEHATGRGLAVAGLMTVGPTSGGPEAARPGFEATRAAVDRLELAVCSMGMTTDLEVAVAAGSTEVRIGTGLFGARPVPVRHDQRR